MMTKKLFILLLLFILPLTHAEDSMGNKEYLKVDVYHNHYTYFVQFNEEATIKNNGKMLLIRDGKTYTFNVTRVKKGDILFIEGDCVVRETNPLVLTVDRYVKYTRVANENGKLKLVERKVQTPVFESKVTVKVNSPSACRVDEYKEFVIKCETNEKLVSEVDKTKYPFEIFLYFILVKLKSLLDF